MKVLLSFLLLCGVAFAQEIATIDDKIDDNSYYRKQIMTYEMLVQERGGWENRKADDENQIPILQNDIVLCDEKIAEINKVIADLGLKEKAVDG